MEKKICSKCRVEKDVCEFYKQPNSNGGVKSICKECRKLEKSKNAEYHLINKEKIYIKKKEWIKKNPDYMKEYGKMKMKCNQKHIITKHYLAVVAWR